VRIIYCIANQSGRLLAFMQVENERSDYYVRTIIAEVEHNVELFHILLSCLSECISRKDRLIEVCVVIYWDIRRRI
jgi:hypothetical protein